MDKKLNIILQTLLDKKAENVVYFDISKKNPMANYFIICTANSNHHAYALAGILKEESNKNNISLFAVEGKSGSDWILVDALDYVVHIFTEESRKKYALEKLYNDLEIIKVEE